MIQSQVRKFNKSIGYSMDINANCFKQTNILDNVIIGSFIDNIIESAYNDMLNSNSTIECIYNKKFNIFDYLVNSKIISSGMKYNNILIDTSIVNELYTSMYFKTTSINNINNIGYILDKNVFINHKIDCEGVMVLYNLDYDIISKDSRITDHTNVYNMSGIYMYDCKLLVYGDKLVKYHNRNLIIDNILK